MVTYKKKLRKFTTQTVHICPFCGEEFAARGYANHIAWKHRNDVTYSDGGKMVMPATTKPPKSVEQMEEELFGQGTAKEKIEKILPDTMKEIWFKAGEEKERKKWEQQEQEKKIKDELEAEASRKEKFKSFPKEGSSGNVIWTD